MLARVASTRHRQGQGSGPRSPHSLLRSHAWPAAAVLGSADSRTFLPLQKSLRWWPRCSLPTSPGPFRGQLVPGGGVVCSCDMRPCCSEVLWHGRATPGPAGWGGQPCARAESCSLGTRGPRTVTLRGSRVPALPPAAL